MELKSKFSYSFILKVCFVAIYFGLLVHFLVISLSSANAASYDISGNLTIPSIDLNTSVTELQLQDGALDTPDTIVGSFSRSINKTLLIGHSTTVFDNLSKLNLDNEILYNGKTYRVLSIDVKKKNEINMNFILNPAPVDTLVLMTCAGQELEGGDATHRLIISAVSI